MIERNWRHRIEIVKSPQQVIGALLLEHEASFQSNESNYKFAEFF
jgi:hypothetical protein